MKKNKIIAMIILILFIGTINLSAFSIYVTDWAALAQRLILWGIEAAKMKKSFDQFKEYADKFEEYKQAFSSAYQGFRNLDTLKDLFVDVEELDKLIDIIYNDPQNMDSWHKIYTGKQSIKNKYPNITNYDFVKKTPIYKRSPVVQKQIEKEINNVKAELNDMQNISNMISQMRTTEKSMLLQIEKMQDEIKDFSIEKKEDNKETAGEFFKLAAANASIRLESLVSDVNTVALIRIMFEKEIKDRINEIDENLRSAREDAATAEANENQMNKPGK